MPACGYISRYPNQVEKAVLAEPGILTSEEAREFLEKVRMNLSIPLLFPSGVSVE
jgi:hypothetical protein